jgi:hypothetical protein
LKFPYIAPVLVVAYDEREKHGTPLYTTPEFNFTVTGAPMISLKNPDGSLPSDAAPFSISVD